MADMEPADPVMAELTAAVELGRGGQRAEARDQLTDLWERIGAHGDPLHRVTLAHFLADLQDDVRQELAWDERALDAVHELTDDRLQEHTASLRVRGLLPSLHLNLADAHRRLGDTERAAAELARAGAEVGHLPDDGYGQLIRSGMDLVRAALAAGSTAPLPTAPRPPATPPGGSDAARSSSSPGSRCPGGARRRPGAR
jgi:hypothetical protein